MKETAGKETSMVKSNQTKVNQALQKIGKCLSEGDGIIVATRKACGTQREFMKEVRATDLYLDMLNRYVAVRYNKNQKFMRINGKIKQVTTI